MRSTIASSLVAALLALSGVAWAQPAPSERAMADALFKEGKALLARGKTAEACEKLASSYRIDPAGGTLINLARCHELLGKTATAWGEFNDALAMANKARNFERQTVAKQHLAALEKRLSRVTLTLPPANAAPGMAITLDGVTLALGALGTGMPVDPGEHTATAAAPGKLPWTTRVTLAEKEDATIVVPALADAPPPPPPPDASASRWRKPLGAVGVGVGSAALLVGAGFGIRALVLGAQVRSACPDQACSPDGLDALGRGRTAANVANALIPIGAALAAGGVVLLVLSPAPAEAPKAGLHVIPAIGPGAVSLAVGGAF